MGKSFVRSKKYRKRKKEIEKLISKKREDARCRKMVSRRKLAKLEIRRSKKITKKQVPLSHEIKDTDVRKITEALACTAKLKAKGQVKLFRKIATACWTSTVLVISVRLQRFHITRSTEC